MISSFPPAETADASGLLAVGGDLEVSSLLLAYRNGIFPWPHEGYPLLWFAPSRRAILEFDRFHIPQRLKRELKKAPFSFHINRDFSSVIKACSKSANRKGQKGTWINQDMINAYIKLYEATYAQSFEAWKGEDLVGGLYGVRIGKMFAGESMFYTVSGASKFAFVNAVEFLKSEGLTWMDIQMLTPLMKSFGAREISRKHFMAKLEGSV